MPRRYQMLLRTVFLAIAVSASAANAQVARVELHAFPSMTLTGPQFLAGEKNGKPVTLAGELRLPGTGTGRLAAVVIMPGTSGIGLLLQQWARELNEIGLATFTLDSFTGRGIAGGTELFPMAATVDAYRALELLSKHPRIDPARIGILGFSWGGSAALYSGMKRFQAMYGSPSLEYAAHVVFYTACFTAYLDDTNVTDRPIRMFHGTADDWMPVEPCRGYVERLRRAGKDAQLTEYAGAHHTFDNAALKEPVRFPKFRTARNCQVEEKAPAQLVNARTGQPFGPSDPCWSLGTTVAYDAKAHAAATRAVREFLAQALRLE